MEGEESEKEPSRPSESTRIDPRDKQCDSGGVMVDQVDGAELEGRPKTLIGSVQRALHLMEAVCTHPSGAPAKLLAREVGLHLGTTYHLPVEFLSDEQAAAYGRFTGGFTRRELERFFLLDDVDRAWWSPSGGITTDSGSLSSS